GAAGPRGATTDKHAAGGGEGGAEKLVRWGHPPRPRKGGGNPAVGEGITEPRIAGGPGHPARVGGGKQERGCGKRREPERGRVGDACSWGCGGGLDCAIFADAQVRSFLVRNGSSGSRLPRAVEGRGARLTAWLA